MDCAIEQDIMLAGIVGRLEATGLSVVAATQAVPSTHPDCSASTGLRRHRRRPQRVAFILFAVSDDAQATHAAIAKSSLATLLRFEPSSSNSNEVAVPAVWPTADLTTARNRNQSPRAPLATTQMPPITSRGQLSAREAEVLRLFVNGALPLQVAQQLYVSPKTVKNHLSHIYAKLGVANRTQAVALAVKQGIIPIG